MLEVETDKAVIEVPCPPGGVVQEVLVKKGETVNVGQALLSLGSSTSQPAEKSAEPVKQQSVESSQPPAVVKQPVVKQPVVEQPVVEQPVVEQPVAAASAPASIVAANGEATDEALPSETVKPAGPAVRRLARELGVDLGSVSGSGPSGRIIREDVVASVRRSGVQSASNSQAVRPGGDQDCLLYTSPSPRDSIASRMPSSA